MALLDFKNVGVKTFEKPKILTTDQSLLPIGIKTPLQFGSDFFEMNYSAQDEIQNNLRDLVLTNFGERVALYDYGANLQPLVTEFSAKEDFDSEAMARIKTAVSKWMGFVELEGFGSEPIYENNRYIGKIAITIEYSVSKIQMFKKRLQVILYVI